MTELLTPEDWSALRVTAMLALANVLILPALATPIAWRLAFARGRWRTFAEAALALPLVLPPTALGFYMLALLAPGGWLGGWFENGLAFSFEGLVIASCVHSLPFAAQPLQNAFEAVGRDRMEAAASLGAGPLNAFFTIAAPLSARGYVTAAVLVFAHTLGEFGVLLMVGGAIPGETRALSIAIYEHVETAQFSQAGALSALLTLLSFNVLLVVYALNRRWRLKVL